MPVQHYPGRIDELLFAEPAQTAKTGHRWLNAWPKKGKSALQKYNFRKSQSQRNNQRRYNVGKYVRDIKTRRFCSQLYENGSISLIIG